MQHRSRPALVLLALASLVGSAALACPPLDDDELAQRPSYSSAPRAAAPEPSASSVAERSVRERTIPAQERTIEAVAPVPLASVLERRELRTFRRAAEATNLAAALPIEGQTTIFIPTNEAFERLNEATRMALRSERNRDNLRRILSHHIVPGRHGSEELLGRTSLSTLIDQEIPVDASYGGISIGAATVVESDIEVEHGLVHLVDRVLIPEGMMLVPDGPLLLGMYVRRPASEMAREMEIDRRGTLLVTQLIDGANAGPAGVRTGDILLSIDGMPASVDAAEQAKKEKGVGADVVLSVLRDGEVLTIRVPVGIGPG